MITDVSEEEWNIPKDPSTKQTKEDTLRSYAKRGVSKKFAQKLADWNKEVNENEDEL